MITKVARKNIHNIGFPFKLPVCTMYIYFQIALMYNLYILSNCPYVQSIYLFKLP